MQWYRVSCAICAVEIAVENGIIKEIEPKLHRFTGRHYSELTQWMKECPPVFMNTIFVGIGEIRANVLKKYVQWEDYKIIKEGDEVLDPDTGRLKREIRM